MRKPDDIQFETQYLKGVDKLLRSGNRKAYATLTTIVELLANGDVLPSKYKNHKLKGVINQWECHVAADILLVYQYDDEGNLLILKLLDLTNHDSLSRKANLRGSIEFEHLYV